LVLPHVEYRHAGSGKICDVPGDHRAAMVQRRRRDEAVDHPEQSSPPLDERRHAPPDRGDRRVDRQDALRIGQTGLLGSCGSARALSSRCRSVQA